jgi:hypothetical protein
MSIVGLGLFTSSLWAYYTLSGCVIHFGNLCVNIHVDTSTAKCTINTLLIFIEDSPRPYFGIDSKLYLKKLS